MGRKYAKNETEKRDKEENKCNEKKGNTVTTYNKQILKIVFFSLETNMAKTVKYSFPRLHFMYVWENLIFFSILCGWKR